MAKIVFSIEDIEEELEIQVKLDKPIPTDDTPLTFAQHLAVYLQGALNHYMQCQDLQEGVYDKEMDFVEPENRTIN